MLDALPLNLKRAHYFVVLAEELHFGWAAKRLYMTQPGLSQQIKTLETELGVLLIDRGGRDIHLTFAGEIFFREATRLLKDATEVVERTRARADDPTYRLIVAYSHSVQYFETELVQDFRILQPETRLLTTVGWTALNIEMLRAHSADVVFVRPPVEEADLETLTLLSEEIVAALPPGHRLANQPSVTPADIADDDVILWPRNIAPGHYDYVIAQIWNHHRPRVVLEEPDDDRRLMAVGQGRGISIFGRERAATLQSQTATIQPHTATIRPFTEPPPTRKLGIAWRREGHTPSIQDFLTLCRQQYPSPRSA